MPRARRVFIAICSFFAILLFSLAALCGPYTLGRGREKDVLALFAPYTLGAEVSDGFRLWTVSIEPQRILVGLRGQSDQIESFELVYPSDAPADSPRSTSFAILRSPLHNAEAIGAQNALIKAVAQNDHSGFWAINATAQPAPPPNTLRAHIASLGNQFTDGIAGLLILWVIAIALATRVVLQSPRWVRFALPAVVLLGIILRLELSPEAMLGAWPYSRVWPNVRLVFEGQSLAAIASHFRQTFYLTDVMTWTNFVYAALMPLVLFSHGSYVLRDPRAGLAAAFAIACLPQHIRFSRCEDAFVPSLVLTSVAFALIHAWLRDSSSFVRISALISLPFVLFPGYLLRPLNILFVAIYVLAIGLLHPEAAPKKRKLVAMGVVLAVFAFAIPVFLRTNPDSVHSALNDPGWILQVLKVVLSPRLLVLTDPRVTPPLLLVLAIAGAVLNFRKGDRRLATFLCAWIGIFLLAHSFVIEPEMQPRYHMHLVVPFLLLAASTIPWLIDASTTRPWARAGLGVAFLSMLSAPFVHLAWIRDLHFPEIAEYAFLKQARETIPENCTVIEYASTQNDAKELRFARIAQTLSERGRTPRFAVVPAPASIVQEDSKLSLEEILAHPPECLYLYEGLPCSFAGSAEACASLRAKIAGEVVLERETSFAPYDRNYSRGRITTGSQVSFRLSRANPAR